MLVSVLLCQWGAHPHLCMCLPTQWPVELAFCASCTGLHFFWPWSFCGLLFPPQSDEPLAPSCGSGSTEDMQS